MGRNRHRRRVNPTPNNIYFPGDSPKTETSIILTVAEFEAMRLKHYLGLNQKESADRMGVSQPTFSRILERAHQKNTSALIAGKKIIVYGGNFETKLGFKGYGCKVCNHEWEDPTASKEKLKAINCVSCNSNNVYHLIREYL